MHSTRKGQQKSIKSVFHVPKLPTETMTLVGLGIFHVCLFFVFAWGGGCCWGFLVAGGGGVCPLIL